MVYYSVLKNIIDKPKTKDELVNAILQKAMSIIREYGIDYLMKHNKDHYFDINDNEIIKIEMDPIVNNAAAEPYEVNCFDYILYNYTKKRLNVIVDNKYRTGYNEPSSLPIKELTDYQLTKINDGLCDCAENVRRDRNMLNAITEMLPVGSFYVFNKDSDLPEYFNMVTGQPYIHQTGIIRIPSIVYKARSSWDFDIDEKKYPYIRRCHSGHKEITDMGMFKKLEKEDLIELVYSKVKDDSCEEQHYIDEITYLNTRINRSKKAIEDAKNKLKTANGKTEILKFQLLIAENEDYIAQAEKAVIENSNNSKNIEGVRNELRKKISDCIDNLNTDKNDNE